MCTFRTISMWRDTLCGRTLLHGLYCLTLTLHLGLPENMIETDTTRNESNETLTTKLLVMKYDIPTFIQSSTITAAPKIPVCEGLLLLLFISACLITGAFLYALLLWIISKVYYFNGDEEQRAAAPEVERLQRLEEKSTPTTHPLQLPEGRVTTERLHHALDDEKSHSLEEVTFDLDPDQLKEKGASRDYVAINAVYKPPSTKKEDLDSSNLRVAKKPSTEKQDYLLRREDPHEQSDKKKSDSETQFSTKNSRSDLLLSPPPTPKIVSQSEKGSDTQRSATSGSTRYSGTNKSSRAAESRRKPSARERYSHRTNLGELLLPLEELEN